MKKKKNETYFEWFVNRSSQLCPFPFFFLKFQFCNSKTKQNQKLKNDAIYCGFPWKRDCKQTTLILPFPFDSVNIPLMKCLPPNPLLWLVSIERDSFSIRFGHINHANQHDTVNLLSRVSPAIFIDTTRWHSVEIANCILNPPCFLDFFYFFKVYPHKRIDFKIGASRQQTTTIAPHYLSIDLSIFLPPSSPSQKKKKSKYVGRWQQQQPR